MWNANMMSPQSDTVGNIASGPTKFNARDISIFNVLSNRIKVIAETNVLGRGDNIRVALPQSYSTKGHSPHHAALSHNYNNKYKCFSQQNSNSKKNAPK